MEGGIVFDDNMDGLPLVCVLGMGELIFAGGRLGFWGRVLGGNAG